MTRCPNPNCRRDHEGPRHLDELRLLLARAVAKSIELPDDKAIEFLRTQATGTGIELAGYCPSCKFNMLLLPVAERHEAAVREADGLLQAATADGEVIDIRRGRKRTPPSIEVTITSRRP